MELPGGTKRGSTWQSLSRRQGSVESDYLNGEVVMLGRTHGIPTPCNATLQRLATTMAAQGRAPGLYSVEELRELASAAGRSKSDRAVPAGGG